jgi:serine/threonine protein kinase
MEIIKNDELTIIKNDDIYKIRFNLPSRELIHSVVKTKIILGSTVTPDYKVIQLKAKSIKSFSQFKQEIQENVKNPELSVVVKMIKTLSDQLLYLINEFSKTFIGYTQERIIVIDDKFVLLSNDLLITIQEKKAILTFPYIKNTTHKEFYKAPELLIINEIPAKVSYKISHYSLGCLIVDFITNNKIFNADIEEVNKSLDKSYIYGTKIYWMLKRCLQKDSKMRCIIFI